jgi:hypothetical protein
MISCCGHAKVPWSGFLAGDRVRVGESGHTLLRNRSGLKSVYCATALKIQDTPVVLSCRTAWRIQNDEPAPLPKGLADE